MQNSEAISLANTKVNVQAYVEKYNLTPEQAHNEIQTFLFEQGIDWCFTNKVVKNYHAYHLFIDSENNLSWGSDASFFNRHENKEIFLERNILLTIKKTPDIIEIEGKKYLKEDVLKAIQQFEIKGE